MYRSPKSSCKIWDIVLGTVCISLAMIFCFWRRFHITRARTAWTTSFVQATRGRLDFGQSDTSFIYLYLDNIQNTSLLFILSGVNVFTIFVDGIPQWCKTTITTRFLIGAPLHVVCSHYRHTLPNCFHKDRILVSSLPFDSVTTFLDLFVSFSGAFEYYWQNFWPCVLCVIKISLILSQNFKTVLTQIYPQFSGYFFKISIKLTY